MNSVPRVAASQPHQTSSTARAPERQPLLPSSAQPRAGFVGHWDRDFMGNRLRRYNRPHQVVRAWVPAPLLPERSARANGAGFTVTAQDAMRGTLITAGTQSLCGTFFVAAAIDFLCAPGPSWINPAGRANPVLGSACIVAAGVGYTIVGAMAGNLWYNALLTMSARHHSVIGRHPAAADNTGAACAITTGLLCLLGAGFLGADLHSKLHAAPADGPAPANAIYEYTLAMLALTTGLHAGVCTNWYVGRSLGAQIVDALAFEMEHNEDLFTHVNDTTEY